MKMYGVFHKGPGISFFHNDPLKEIIIPFYREGTQGSETLSRTARELHLGRWTPSHVTLSEFKSSSTFYMPKTLTS